MNPGLQQRHFDYVLGPNQDSRLASVATGRVITEVLLEMDDDAPFVLTGRAVRCSYGDTFSQAPLQGLKTRWTGPDRDYRTQNYLRESLGMVYYGQSGNPKPIAPAIVYPSRSVLMLDLINTGASAIPNLTFFFRGYKLFPQGAVPAYTYPRRMASQTFSYPVPVVGLGIAETRQNLIFTVKDDADFVLRGGQAPRIANNGGGRVLANVSIRLKDHQKNPYSSDFMPFDVLFGSGDAGAFTPLGPTPSFVSPFGTGPGQPGLFYPEIYVPQNYQLLYDLQRADTGNQAEDFQFNLIGGKVFDR